MKSKLFKSVAFISLMAVIIICGAKKSVYAQQKKEIKKTIIIKNGDTIINGKNLKELSRAERKQQQKELDEMPGKQRIEINRNDKREANMQVIIRKKKDGEAEEVIVKNLRSPQVDNWNNGDVKVFVPDGAPQHFSFKTDTLMIKMENDSAFRQMRIRMKDLDSTMRKQFSFRNSDGGDLEFFVHPPQAPGVPPAPHMRIFERKEFTADQKNTQSYTYSNIDKDGISNRMNIRLSEPSKEALQKITGLENAKTSLDVQDLNIFPSFSTGKINVAFSLKSKGALELKILDSSFQTIFSNQLVNPADTNHQSLALPKNGVYYLVLKQGGNSLVKKMLKE